MCFLPVTVLLLLLQMCAALDVDSAAAVAAVCRLLLPSSCAWVLTAAGQGRYVGNRQLLADQQLQSTLPAASTSNVDASSDDITRIASSSNQQKQQQQLGGFASAAAAACQPSHLLELFELIASSERCCSKHLQQTPHSMRLLHVTLDCCLLTWPTAAFTPQVLQKLLSGVVLMLLGSTRSLSAMAGLRALHIVMLRGLINIGATAKAIGENCHQQQQQQEVQGAAGLSGVEQLLLLLDAVCLLLKSPDVAVRMEVSGTCPECVYRCSGLK
jgi:hypothetical protein